MREQVSTVVPRIPTLDNRFTRIHPRALRSLLILSGTKTSNMSRTVPIQTKRTKFSGAPPKRRKATQATQVRKIARALGVENKYFDVPVGFTIPATVDWASTEVGADMPQIPSETTSPNVKDVRFCSAESTSEALS